MTHTREWEKRMWEKYSDKGDERFGLVKHNNTVLQNIIDDSRDEINAAYERGRTEEIERTNESLVTISIGAKHQTLDAVEAIVEETKIENMAAKPESEAEEIDERAYSAALSQLLARIKALRTNN